MSRKKTVKRKRCPNGTQRNKKTGNCETKGKKTKLQKPGPKPTRVDLKKTVKRKRCPNGTQRNKKTGNCETKGKKTKLQKPGPKPTHVVVKKNNEKGFNKTKTMKKNKNVQTPTHDKSLRSYMRSQIKKLSKQVVPYTCHTLIRKFMLLHLIKNNKNTCLYNILEYPEITATYKNIKYKNESIQAIKQHYNSCKKDMKLFAMPFIIANGRHANMIIFNPYRNEAERFEPHGPNTVINGFNHANITNELRKFVALIDPELKFVPSHKTCPIGFKAFQRFDTNKPSRQKIDGTYIKDPGGYCCAWSFFYADLRMKYPKASGSEIINKSGVSVYW